MKAHVHKLVHTYMHVYIYICVCVQVNMMNEKVWEETIIGNPPNWQNRHEGRRKSGIASGGVGKRYL